MRAPELEFSRRIAVSDLSAAGRAFAVEAAADECTRLARRLDLVAVHRLKAEGVVVPLGVKGDLRLGGRIEAEVERICVVSLEPFCAPIEIPIERLYSPRVHDEWSGAGESSPGGELEIEGEGDTFFEPLIGTAIDVGEAVVQELALALDPYPRKPGAIYADSPAAAAGERQPDGGSPFSVLYRRRPPGAAS